MKKEDFCEILGDIDPKHVTTARSPAKRKTADKAKWYAVAACLCLIAGFLIFASGTKSQPNSSVVVSSSTADVAPMIFVNNKLFKQAVNQTFYTDFQPDFLYLGDIKTDISRESTSYSDGIPRENFQCNIPIVGAKVYQYGENIVVLVDQGYWLYESAEAQNDSRQWNELTEEEKKQLDPSYHP